eukprot:TRINITY_DN2761_c0_g1_i7.p2 TRINITY_DN2761_c0_g1~~TRINITY_DN2761_c0_g1_i7.p2  ORF type:complete len:111 (-),score=3.62 TRINITY_DN2761_c0_g1_i7:12-302(-)
MEEIHLGQKGSGGWDLFGILGQVLVENYWCLPELFWNTLLKWARYVVEEAQIVQAWTKISMRFMSYWKNWAKAHLPQHTDVLTNNQKSYNIIEVVQ